MANEEDPILSELLEGKIHKVEVPPPRERCVQLRTQQLFNKLVDLYEILFTETWASFGMFDLAGPSRYTPAKHAALVYISAWFIDLYIGVRHEVGFMATQLYPHYEHPLIEVSKKYDPFLLLLKKSISPVRVQDTIDNGLYIPIISSRVMMGPNPFGIANFILNRAAFTRLIQKMTLSESWIVSMSPTPSIPEGGSHFWLADWPDPDHLAIWFPSSNFSTTDVSIAYVLGLPLTSNFGLRDVDQWQPYQFGVIGPNPYERVSDRSFTGGREVRTLDIDANHHRIAFRGEPRERDPRCRVVDWAYNDCWIVLRGDLQSRLTVLKHFSIRA